MARPAHDRARHPADPERSIAALVNRLHDALGPEVEGFGTALRTDPPVSIRINPAKWRNAPETDPVPWCAHGRYLAERPAFTFDPLLHAGAYYVQEAASMLIEQAVQASGLADERILALDLCAAPGGKSTHLRDLLHPDALLVSNEVNGERRSVLKENLWKWGAANVLITGAAPERFGRLEGLFDLVLVDAPCSGEGMVRKDPHALRQWSPSLVEQCTTVQRAVLAQAWNCLRPGGHLIYSTCTWEIGENEARIKELVDDGGEVIAIPSDSASGILATSHLGIAALRCYPHRLRGEGFVLSLLRKPGDRGTMGVMPQEPAHQGTELAWLRPTRSWRTIEQGDELFAIDGSWVRTIETLQRSLSVVSPGIPLAERKAGSWRPHAGLALAQDLDLDRHLILDLDLDEAIDLLRGQSIGAREVSGVALATYRGIPLSWLQGAGNRWNNRWPAPWRIQSARPSAPPVSWSA